jgi:hypothetical protein
VRGTMERKLKRTTTVWRARANGHEQETDARLTTGGV